MRSMKSAATLWRCEESLTTRECCSRGGKKMLAMRVGCGLNVRLPLIWFSLISHQVPHFCSFKNYLSLTITFVFARVVQKLLRPLSGNVDGFKTLVSHCQLDRETLKF